MAKKPDSDLINRRLRMKGADAPRNPALDKDDDDEQRFPFEFAAMVAAVVLTVGVGSYVWFTGGSFLPSRSNAMASVVDPECRHLWVGGAKNTPGLVCYLTTKPERLCDPKERVHLAAVMQQYRLDRNAYATNMTLGGLKAVAIMKTQSSTSDMMAMASAIDGAGDGKVPSVEQTAAIDRHFNTVKRMEQAVSDAVPDAAFKLEHISDQELSGKIRDLAVAGYVSKSDFGWFTDPLVEEAFKDLGPVNVACRS